MGSPEQFEAAGTVGVEEEFLLVDTTSGVPVPHAPAVIDRVHALAPGSPTTIKPELMATQVEAATGVCGTLPGLAEQVRIGRRLLGSAAGGERAWLVAVGAPVLAGSSPPLSTGPRFERIIATYRDVVADYQTCGCHVHVGVPDRALAIEVVNHLRPWLPTLLALSANSPFRAGRDTGYASWRMVEQSRFPGSGVPPRFRSIEDYDAKLARLVDCGSLVDTRMSFWLARPSEVFATVEVRAADAAATAEEAVLQAALVRALVRTALAKIEAGVDPPGVGDQVAAAALWSAARHGLHGPAVDPWAERQVPAVNLVERLLRDVAAALEDTGDLRFVRTTVDQLLRSGTGACRQRWAARNGPLALIRLLAGWTSAEQLDQEPDRRQEAR
ncbi:putative glutamate--cysteine ligase 2 [Saccharopolyspora subtropica]|uniref:Putative glutamate--cysteine ligase 2 n=1 Tax=Saccharopolyspora thermophila TaxID=89367 RepID=A0A917K854_9PSEU|nr:glutamate--cysteine ligase [Saccharopolyspora subtropica]GGJ03477.1 putative glutamate--cysteine ligase 2 [Saccharopolyspora subtropica]